MLECTWNDVEAQTALRRMLIDEQKRQKLLAANPKMRKEHRESVMSQIGLKRITGTAGDSDTL